MAVIAVRRRGRERRTALMSEINVTPFVDVMLVLLVVFMVTAPLLTVGVPVDLPKTQAPEITGKDEPLAVTVDAQGRIFIQDTEVAFDQLAPRLMAITERNPGERIFIRGDQAIRYGRMMAVMGAITDAGFTDVALITELPKERTAR